MTNTKNTIPPTPTNLGRNISHNTGTITGTISRTPVGTIPISGTTTIGMNSNQEGLYDARYDQQQYMKMYLTTFARDKDEKESKMEEDN